MCTNRLVKRLGPPAARSAAATAQRGPDATRTYALAESWRPPRAQVPVLVIRTGEARQIARETRQVLQHA